MRGLAHLTLPHPVIVGQVGLEDPQAAVPVTAPARPLVLALLHPHWQPQIRDDITFSRFFYRCQITEENDHFFTMTQIRIMKNVLSENKVKLSSSLPVMLPHTLGEGGLLRHHTAQHHGGAGVDLAVLGSCGEILSFKCHVWCRHEEHQNHS